MARPAIRTAYADHPGGASGFYAESGASYRNPHEPGVRLAVQQFAPRFPPGRVLDLACGSGEVTLALRDAGFPSEDIDGADPYTGEAYRARTGNAAFPWSFTDRVEPDRYGTVVCSFALHLCDRSRLPSVVLALALAADALLIITPHKRPAIQRSWGFDLVEERYEPLHRVRSRLYRSLLRSAPPSTSPG